MPSLEAEEQASGSVVSLSPHAGSATDVVEHAASNATSQPLSRKGEALDQRPSSTHDDSRSTQMTELDKRSALATEKDEEIRDLKELADKRLRELCAITLHLRSIEAERQAGQPESGSLQNQTSATKRQLQELARGTESLDQRYHALLLRQGVDLLAATRRSARQARERQLLETFFSMKIDEEGVFQFALRTGLFDPGWYLSTYSLAPMDEREAFVHYVTHGHEVGFNPSPLFDSQEYLRSHEDVRAGRSNPLYHFLRYGICESREFKPARKSLTMRAIMMEKNEHDLIVPWVLFHGAIFGFENLHIVDNGSNSMMKERLRMIEDCGVHVYSSFNSKAEFANRSEVVSDLVRSMNKADPADFYFPLSCDQFVGVQSEAGRLSFEFDDIAAALSQHLGSSVPLAIDVMLENHPSEPGKFKRRTEQRRIVIPSNAQIELSHGFRLRQTTNPTVVTSLAYVHYHFKPFRLMQVHARQRLEAFTDDFSEKALRKYIEERRTTFHSAAELLMGERAYLRVDSREYEDIPEFANALSSVGLPLPFADGYFSAQI